ncbi:MAG: hypothetical protein LBP20_08565 [Treponema sp.]|nr:hypothetical protein [Treponema sp.]
MTENLQRFYDAGVRYILVEGGGGRKDDSPVYSDEELLDRGILLFYPWEYVGVRYSARDWGGVSGTGKANYLINADKEGRDRLTRVGLEWGRMSVIPGSTDPWELLNYRDEYMAGMAFEYIDKAAPGEKFLVLAGGEHGISVRTGPHSDPDVWKPLGMYLREKYGKNFISLYYITLDETIKMDGAYRDLLESDEWRNMPEGPRLVAPRQARKLFNVLPILYNPTFDGYIIDKAGIKGVMYSYTLFMPEVMRAIIDQTKEYEAVISVLSRENNLDYENVDLYYNIRNLLANVYYLRLFFGDYFPYSFWNPEMPLKNALAALESLVFSVVKNPADLMRFPVPAVETIRDYHDHIELFALINGLNNNEGDNNKLERQFKTAEPYLKKAHELFPYELWTEYWYGKMYYTLTDYEKAYEHLRRMLDDPLIVSMQIYPETLEMAAFCAERIGNQEQAVEYRAVKNGLANEFGIDTTRFHLFL